MSSVLRGHGDVHTCRTMRSGSNCAIWQRRSRHRNTCLRREDYSRAWGLIRAVFTLVAIISSVHKACADQPNGVQRKEAGPPIIALPLDVVEPPRNVPAIQWNSPYCGHWDDGCVECRRQTVLAPLKCDEEAPVRGHACRRHAIACYEIIDESVFAQICKRFLSEGFIEDALGYNYVPTRIIVGPSIRCFSNY